MITDANSDQIVKDLVQILNRFLQIPVDELRQYILDSAWLPGGEMASFVNIDLLDAYNVLKNNFNITPEFLKILENRASQAQSIARELNGNTKF